MPPALAWADTLPICLREGNQAALDARLDWFLRVFGEDRYYLEIQPEDQHEQKIFNHQLYDLSKRRGIPLVATGDCHYPSLADHEAHEVMLAIQTHDKMDNHDRYTFGDCRVYMRTADEMLAQFPGHDEAVWNTGVIADACNFEFQTGKLFFPQFEIPKDHTPASHFKYLSELGFEKLLNNERIPREQEAAYRDRLKLEIELITSMGFVEYFLVVSDFIQWARRNGIPVGPGRGSAAGSLVSWALEITDIDPIKYNLLFERFLKS